MRINTQYDLGQIVYLKTDVDQLPRMVTGITIRNHGVVYELSQGTSESNHYDYEMSVTKDILISMTA